MKPIPIARGATRRGRVVAGEAALFLAGLSLVTAMIHFVVAVPHFEESAVEAVLFLVAGAAQTVWAFAVYQLGDRPVLLAGAVLNVGIVLVWLVSRTVGIPGEGAEAVGFADLSAGAAECALVAGSLVAAGRPGRPLEALSPATRQLALTVLIFAGVGLMASGHHH